MGFRGILAVLQALQEKHPSLGKRIREAEAMERWEAAVGPGIAKHARPLRVVDGVLWVEVSHPAWRSELHYRKRQILEILNAGRPALGSDRPELAPADVPVTDLWLVEPKGGSTKNGSTQNGSKDSQAAVRKTRSKA